MLTTWWTWACSPQASWSLKIDSVNPWDTAQWPHHQPIRELCTSRSQTLGCPSLTWASRMFCWNPTGSSGILSTSCPALLACPCNKYFSLPNSDVSVYLASLCIGYTNLHSVILVVTTVIKRRGNMGIWMPQRSWVRKHPCPHTRCLYFLIEGLECKAASPWFNGLLEHLF